MSQGLQDGLDSVTKSANAVYNLLQEEGEEPVSGKQGKGTAEQPYDQGNASETQGGTGDASAQGKLAQAKETVTQATDSATEKKK